MSDGKIFLVGAKDDLVEMSETAYVREDVLQQWLAQYPDLLPGDQITPDAPRRWLLVAREMGVPGDETEYGRWSLDHLYLDQDGIPTFVECKRATDTRIRREVVAQMLDYAANGIVYWTMDRLRQAAADTASYQGKVLNDEVQRLLEGEEDPDIEAYWQQVEKNLNTGNVRLIFVADRIPKELRRLVEFLNEKLLDVEVLAVEVKQFLGERQTALVPRLVGMTESARNRKAGGRSGRTNRIDFLSKLAETVVPVFERLLDIAQERGHTLYWGQKGFSIRAKDKASDKLISFVYGWPTNHIDFYFGYLPISEEEKLPLKQQFIDTGIFVKSGKQTLKIDVLTVNTAEIFQAYKTILEKVESITASNKTEG